MALLSCPVELQRVQDYNNNAFEDFENTPSLEWMHRLPPRFGKTDEVMNFIQRRGIIRKGGTAPQTPVVTSTEGGNSSGSYTIFDSLGQESLSSTSKANNTIQPTPSFSAATGATTEDDYILEGIIAQTNGRDYAIGVLGLSIAVGCFFFVWTILLCGCYLAGYDRVGIFSGRRVGPPLPIKPYRDLQEKEDAMMAQAIQQSQQQLRQCEEEEQQHDQLQQQQQPSTSPLSPLQQQTTEQQQQHRLDQRIVPKDEKSIASMPDFSDDDSTMKDYLTPGSILGSLDEEKYDDHFVPFEASPVVAHYSNPQQQHHHSAEANRQLLSTPERPTPKIFDGKEASPRYERYRQHLSSGAGVGGGEGRGADDDHVGIEKDRQKNETTTITTTTTTATNKAKLAKPFLPSTPNTPGTQTTSDSTATSTSTDTSGRPFLPDMGGGFDGDGHNHDHDHDDELPLSHYESAAVARKRVIEEYVRSRSKKVEYHDFWAPEEYARVISPPPSMEEEKVPEGEEEAEVGALSSLPPFAPLSDSYLPPPAIPQQGLGTHEVIVRENAKTPTIDNLTSNINSGNKLNDMNNNNSHSNETTTRTATNKGKSVRFHLDDDQALREWQKELHASEGWLQPIRLGIVTAGLCLVVAAILCAVSGIDVLWKSVDDAWEGLSQLQRQTHEVSDALVEIIGQQEMARNVTSNLLRQVNTNYCPRVASSFEGELCPNVTDSNWTTGDCDVLSLNVLPHNEELKELVRTLGGGEGVLDVLFPPLVEQKMLLELDGLERSMRKLEQALEYAPSIFWTATAVVDLLAILCLVLLFGVILAYAQRQIPQAYMMIRTRLIMPLFVILLVLELFATLTWILSSVGAADFCIDSPDRRMELLLEQHRVENAPSYNINNNTIIEESTSIIYSLANYYVSSCPSEGFPPLLDDRVITTATTLTAVSRWATAISTTNPNTLEATCGTPDLSELQMSASIASLVLCMLTQSLASMRDLAGCGKWQPLYESTTYDAICYDGSYGLAWAAFTQVWVVLMGYIILTLRAILYEAEDPDADQAKTRKRGGSRVCRWCPRESSDNRRRGVIHPRQNSGNAVDVNVSKSDTEHASNG